MRRQLIWDLPVRVFHWALVLLIGTSWGSAELGRMDLHHYSGYAVATLLLFRLAWGIAGPRYARFTAFITGPRRLFRYLRTLAAGDVSLTAGHTPAGGWMILLLLALLAAQVATGMVNSHDGLDAGPWYWAASSALRDFAHAWHARLFDLLLVISAVHVLAVLSYRLRPGVDLVRPMITGRKLTAEPGIPGSRLPLALALLLAAAATVWLIVRAAPAPGLADLGIY